VWEVKKRSLEQRKLILGLELPQLRKIMESWQKDATKIMGEASFPSVPQLPSIEALLAAIDQEETEGRAGDTAER
jgi:hypothetical protein